MKHNQVRLYGKLTEGDVVVMPYYIATVWTASTDQHGVTEHTRQVRRHQAASVPEFHDRIRSEDANDECIIGPVGLSKDQSTYERDYPNPSMSLSTGQ